MHGWGFFGELAVIVGVWFGVLFRIDGCAIVKKCKCQTPETHRSDR